MISLFHTAFLQKKNMASEVKSRHSVTVLLYLGRRKALGGHSDLRPQCNAMKKQLSLVRTPGFSLF